MLKQSSNESKKCPLTVVLPQSVLRVGVEGHLQLLVEEGVAKCGGAVHPLLRTLSQETVDEIMGHQPDLFVNGREGLCHVTHECSFLKKKGV